MKRSERLYQNAQRELLMCVTVLAAGVAVGVWAVRAWQSTASGGVLVLACALAVLRLALWHGREAMRLERLGNAEMLHEADQWRRRLM